MKKILRHIWDETGAKMEYWHCGKSFRLVPPPKGKPHAFWFSISKVFWFSISKNVLVFYIKSFLVFNFTSFLVFYLKSWLFGFLFQKLAESISCVVSFHMNSTLRTKLGRQQEKTLPLNLKGKALIKSLLWKWIKNRDIPSANIGILTFFSISSQNIAVRKFIWS